MISYKTDNAEIILGPEKEEDIIIRPEMFAENDVDPELNSILNELLINLDSDDNPQNLLMEIDQKLSLVHYDITTLIDETNTINFLIAILIQSAITPVTELVLRILTRILQVAPTNINNYYKYTEYFLPNISNPILMPYVISILASLIINEPNFCELLVCKYNILRRVSTLLINTKTVKDKSNMLSFIYITLKNSKNYVLHSYVDGFEAISYPLGAAKDSIENNISIYINLKIFHYIMMNWTSNFATLFDSKFVQKLLSIWNNLFQNQWEIPFCGEICAIWNQIIVQYPDEFIQNKLYKHVTDVTKQLIDNPDLPHAKILFLLSNVAVHTESALEIINSDILEKYSDHYDEMTFPMKENFLFMFINLIRSRALIIDDSPKTVEYLTEVFDLASDDSSEKYQLNTLILLEDFMQELSEVIDVDFVLSMLNCLIDSTNEEINTLAQKLLNEINPDNEIQPN
ncbi:hypothetical protein TVAG_391450 [Trichomonas vaginalis G3]|uniref:Uncharacterized protein n=1 Tax=Trichomonas vaginalis (strain ATCC PRA-98 / G3) TaxID=412133 RepID=A2DFQ8_TRIV3|nr:armadillo (ARM) repeat-containing protein family [Trichomonas vaginalis G3]EAY20761.1 hypothetical protein TVAG_391450 [Trichomonas vaginalis G3]KAI5529453.1 armadillo (ARM) repeat-containing protein family [Trichomonas vaginalis G3]|eukprot:XP_001581747.1 hypothetical protein [Trichomonas vaginalis G3]